MQALRNKLATLERAHTGRGKLCVVAAGNASVEDARTIARAAGVDPNLPSNLLVVLHTTPQSGAAAQRHELVPAKLLYVQNMR